MRLQERIKSLWRHLLTEKENATYSYGCVMLKVDINKDKWDEIQDLVDDDDIHEGDQYGREDEPHVTLLYGLHADIKDEDVEEFVKEFEPIQLTLDKVGIFPGADYDVVKFEITDKNLTKYNKMLKDNFDYTNSFPDYKAHVTIAYVTSGKGKEIAERINKKLETMEFQCNEIKYSKANKEKNYYKLTKNG